MKIKAYMGQEQRAYIKAVARLQEVTASVEAMLPPAPPRGDHAALENYARVREKASARYRLYEAIDAKLKARWALLDWAKGILTTKLAGDPDLDDALGVFDRAPRYPEMLEDLVAQCLELNPAKADEEGA